MVPPLVGVAVNVTFVPAQMAPGGLAAIVTAGIILEEPDETVTCKVF